MKKWLIRICLILGIMLCGCSGGEDFEVIADSLVDSPKPEPAKMVLTLPSDVTLSVMEGSDWECYEGEHYQIILQTCPSGSLDQTLQLVTGYSKEQLNVMEISATNVDKYFCAWSSVSEAGEVVGRCTILDDGMYHYCLSILIDAEVSGEVRDTINAVFATYSLEGY